MGLIQTFHSPYDCGFESRASFTMYDGLASLRNLHQTDSAILKSYFVGVKSGGPVTLTLQF